MSHGIWASTQIKEHARLCAAQSQVDPKMSWQIGWTISAMWQFCCACKGVISSIEEYFLLETGKFREYDMKSADKRFVVWSGHFQ